jgi:hypothetical protein
MTSPLAAIETNVLDLSKRLVARYTTVSPSQGQPDSDLKLKSYMKSDTDVISEESLEENEDYDES